MRGEGEPWKRRERRRSRRKGRRRRRRRRKSEGVRRGRVGRHAEVKHR